MDTKDLHPIAAHISGRLAAWQSAMKAASAQLRAPVAHAVAPPPQAQPSTNGETRPDGPTTPLS